MVRLTHQCCSANDVSRTKELHCSSLPVLTPDQLNLALTEDEDFVGQAALHEDTLIFLKEEGIRDPLEPSEVCWLKLCKDSKTRGKLLTHRAFLWNITLYIHSRMPVIFPTAP